MVVFTRVRASEMFARLFYSHAIAIRSRARVATSLFFQDATRKMKSNVCLSLLFFFFFFFCSAFAQQKWIPDDASVLRCNGTDSLVDCCTPETPCDWMEGPCTSDDQCSSEFKCSPSPNCLLMSNANCCYYPKPSSTGKVNYLKPRQIEALFKRVNDRIDAGVCDDVTSLIHSEGGRCEDEAYHFYETFVRKVNGVDKRVLITSGIPNYPAGQDTISFHSPFRRCEIWRFVVMPVDPAKTEGEGTRTGMSSSGNIVTGGHLFNDMSKPDGTLAVAEESENLDGCSAHAAPMDRAYHYHYNLVCDYSPSTVGASDPRKCVHIGFLYDGVPVYGYCHKMTSCYKLKEGKTESEVPLPNGGSAMAATSAYDYEYDQASFDAGECTLDKANGAYLPAGRGRPVGRYATFMTSNYPYVPIYYMGEEGEQASCSAAE